MIMEYGTPIQYGYLAFHLSISLAFHLLNAGNYSDLFILSHYLIQTGYIMTLANRSKGFKKSDVANPIAASYVTAEIFGLYMVLIGFVTMHFALGFSRLLIPSLSPTMENFYEWYFRGVWLRVIWDIIYANTTSDVRAAETKAKTEAARKALDEHNAALSKKSNDEYAKLAKSLRESFVKTTAVERQEPDLYNTHTSCVFQPAVDHVVVYRPN